MSKRRPPTALSILIRALLVIRGRRCHNFTTGLGSCFSLGRRTIGAEYGADKACDACIAARALNLAVKVK